MATVSPRRLQEDEGLPVGATQGIIVALVMILGALLLLLGRAVMKLRDRLQRVEEEALRERDYPPMATRNGESGLVGGRRGRMEDKEQPLAAAETGTAIKPQHVAKEADEPKSEAGHSSSTGTTESSSLHDVTIPVPRGQGAGNPAQRALPFQAPAAAEPREERVTLAGIRAQLGDAGRPVPFSQEVMRGRWDEPPAEAGPPETGKLVV